jgi:hypothetical protein
LGIEGRENGDLGAVAPYSGVPLNLQMNETHILIRLLPPLPTDELIRELNHRGRVVLEKLIVA